MYEDFVPDPDYMAGMIHRVAVYDDSNAKGTVTTAHGAVPNGWVPIAGLDDVPCRVIFDSPYPRDTEVKPGEAQSGTVMFGTPLVEPDGSVCVLGRNRQLVYTDRAGQLVLLYPLGPQVNAHEMDHHWTVPFRSFPA